MIRIKNYIFLLIAITIGVVACDDMHDNYEDYLQEKIYPGKVDSLRVYIGFEKLFLGWDSPKDPKSKNVVIKYGSDSVVTDVAVDTMVLTALTSGGGYDIELYSVDEYGNQSVKIYASAMPISQMWVDANIVIPRPKIKPTDGVNPDSLDITWNGLATDIMQYTGELEYTLKKGDVDVVTGTAEGADWEAGIEEISIKDLELESNYRLEYDLRMIPRINTKNTADTVTVSEVIEFTPSDYLLAPIYLLAESNGWDESSFIRFDAIAQGVYSATVDLKHGDILRFFDTNSMDVEKQYGYSSFSSDKIELLEDSDDGNDNFRFTHSDGTYIITVDLDGKAVSIAGTVATAYRGLPSLIPGRVEFEHYDTGGQNIGYYDTSDGNNGNGLRSEDVDIAMVSPTNYVIGWTSDGEWLTYTVDVLSSGTYQVDYIIASPGTPGSLIIEENGVDILTYALSTTGGWGNSVTQTAGTINLDEGRYIFKIKMVAANMNLDAMIFTKQ